MEYILIGDDFNYADIVLNCVLWCQHWLSTIEFWI